MKSVDIYLNVAHSKQSADLDPESNANAVVRSPKGNKTEKETFIGLNRLDKPSFLSVTSFLDPDDLKNLSEVNKSLRNEVDNLTQIRMRAQAAKVQTIVQFNQVLVSAKEVLAVPRSLSLAALAKSINALPIEKRLEAFNNIYPEILKLPDSHRPAALAKLIGVIGRLPKVDQPRAFNQLLDDIKKSQENDFGTSSASSSLADLAKSINALPIEKRLEAFNNIYPEILKLPNSHRPAAFAKLIDVIGKLPEVDRLKIFKQVSDDIHQFDQTAFSEALAELSRAIPFLKSTDQDAMFNEVFNTVQTFDKRARSAVLTQLANAVSSEDSAASDRRFNMVFDSVQDLDEFDRSGPLAALSVVIPKLRLTSRGAMFEKVFGELQGLDDASRSEVLTRLGGAVRTLPAEERAAAFLKLFDAVRNLNDNFRGPPLAGLCTMIPYHKPEEWYLTCEQIFDASRGLDDRALSEVLTEQRFIIQNLPFEKRGEAFNKAFKAVQSCDVRYRGEPLGGLGGIVYNLWRIEERRTPSGSQLEQLHQVIDELAYLPIKYRKLPAQTLTDSTFSLAPEIGKALREKIAALSLREGVTVRQ